MSILLAIMARSDDGVDELCGRREDGVFFPYVGTETDEPKLQAIVDLYQKIRPGNPRVVRFTPSQERA